jgi:hypothetical protein
MVSKEILLSKVDNTINIHLREKIKYEVLGIKVQNQMAIPAEISRYKNK